MPASTAPTRPRTDNTKNSLHEGRQRTCASTPIRQASPAPAPVTTPGTGRPQLVGDGDWWDVARDEDPGKGEKESGSGERDGSLH